MCGTYRKCCYKLFGIFRSKNATIYIVYKFNKSVTIFDIKNKYCNTSLLIYIFSFVEKDFWPICGFFLSLIIHSMKGFYGNANIFFMKWSYVVMEGIVVQDTSSSLIIVPLAKVKWFSKYMGIRRYSTSAILLSA